MNVFDILLLSLAGILVAVGVVKGLVRILIGLAALLASFVLAARYHQTLAEAIHGLDLAIEIRRLIAYLVIFLGTMLAGALIAYLTRKLLKAAMLGWADRLGGAALGFLAATLAAALVVLPLVAYLPNSGSMLARSTLAPYVTVVADLAKFAVPEDLSQRYRQRIEDLRRQWRERGPEGLPAPDPEV